MLRSSLVYPWSPMGLWVPLVASPYLDPVSELASVDGASVSPSPDDYEDWGEMFDDNPGVIDVVLRDDADYLGWGQLQLAAWATTPRSGTSNRRLTIRSENPLHPSMRSTRTLVGPMDFWGCEHWTLSGLDFTGVCAVRQDSSDFVIHECRFETPSYGVRLFGKDSTLQRSMFLDQSTSSDAPAIHIDPTTGNSPTGNKILDNEVRNYSDAIAVSDIDGDFTDVSGTIIDGNDCYLTSAKYLYENGGEYADAENAIDVKNGSPEAGNPIIISNNRFWGWRPTAPSVSEGGKGSNGAAITFHFYARNALFVGNIVDDSPIGFHESIWPVTSGLTRDPRGVTLRDNMFAKIRRFSNGADEGAILRTEMAIALDGNTGIDCGRLASKTLAAGATGSNAIDRMLLIGTTDLGEWASEWAAGNDNSFGGQIPFAYERQRFTG